MKILSLILLIFLVGCGEREYKPGEWRSTYCYEVPKITKRVIPLRARESHGGIDVEVRIEWVEDGIATVCSSSYAPNKK